MASHTGDPHFSVIMVCHVHVDGHHTPGNTVIHISGKIGIPVPHSPGNIGIPGPHSPGNIGTWVLILLEKWGPILGGPRFHMTLKVVCMYTVVRLCKYIRNSTRMFISCSSSEPPLTIT